MEHFETGQTADVHPDEIENFAEAGYRRVYSEADAKAQAEGGKTKGKK